MFRTRGLTAFPLLILLFASTLPAQSDSVYKGFVRVDDFLVEIDGKLDDKAEIYFQQRIPAYLVLPSASTTPLLLVPRTRAVQAVDLMRVQNQPSGALDLLDGALRGTRGQFEIDGSEIRWDMEGATYRLMEKPALLGLHPAAGLQEYSKNYVTGAEAYVPDAALMQRLGEESRKVQFRVYFGSWCPYCQRFLPKVVRVAKDLRSENVEIDFYGFPRQISTDPVAQEIGISAVPTGVLFVDGKEVGRFEREDWPAPERGLLRLLDK